MSADVKSFKVKSRRRINSFSNTLKILGVVLCVQNVHSLSWLGAVGGVHTPLIRAGYSSSLVILLSFNGYYAGGAGISEPASVSMPQPPQPELHTELIKSNRSPRKLHLITSTLRTVGCIPKFFCGMEVKDTRWSDLAFLIKFALRHPVKRSPKANVKNKNGPNVGVKIPGIGNTVSIGPTPGGLGTTSGSFVGPPGGFVNEDDDSDEHQLNSQNVERPTSSEEESNSEHDENDSSDIQVDEESQNLDDPFATMPIPTIGTKSKKTKSKNKYKDEEALVDELLSKLEIAMEATKPKDDTQLETILADLKQIMFRSGRSQESNSTNTGRRGRGAFWEEFHFQKEMSLAAKIRHKDLASQKLDEICTSTFIHCPYTITEMKYMTQNARAEEYQARSEFESLFPKPPPLTPPPPTTPYPKPPPLTPTPTPNNPTSSEVRAIPTSDTSTSEEDAEEQSPITSSTSSNQTQGNSITNLINSILPISLSSNNQINVDDDKSRTLRLTPTPTTSTSTTQIMSSAKNYGMSILNRATPTLRNFLHKSAAYLGLSEPEESVTVDDDETGFDSNSHNGGDYNDHIELSLSSPSQVLREPSHDFTTRNSKALPKSETDFTNEQGESVSSLPISRTWSKVNRRALDLDEPEEDEDSWEGQELKKTSSSEEHQRPPQPDREHDRHVVPHRGHEQVQEEQDREMEREDDDLLEQEEQARTSEEMSDEKDLSPGPPYPPGPPHPPPGQPHPPRPSSVLGHDFKKVEAQWGSVEQEPPESSEEEEPKKKTKKKRKKQKVSQDLGPPPTPIRPTARPLTITTLATTATPVTNSPSKFQRDPNSSPLKKWEKNRLGQEPPKPQTTQQSIMEVLFGTRSTTSKPENGLFKKKRKSPFHILIKNALTSEKVTNFLGHKVDIPMYGDEEDDPNSSYGGHHLNSEESLWSPPFKNQKRMPRPRPASNEYAHLLWQDQHTNSPHATWSHSQEQPLVYQNPQSGYNPMTLSSFDQSPTFGYQQQQSQYQYQEHPSIGFQFPQSGLQYQSQAPQPPPPPPPVGYQQQYSMHQPQQEGTNVGPPPSFPYFRAVDIEPDSMFGDPVAPKVRELQQSSIPRKQVATVSANPSRQRNKSRPEANRTPLSASAPAPAKRPNSVSPKKRIPQRDRTPTTATTPLPRQRTRTRGTPTTTEKMESYGYTTQNKRKKNGGSHKQITSWEDPVYDGDTGQDFGHDFSWETPNSREPLLERDTFSNSELLNSPQLQFKQQIHRSDSIHNYKSAELETRYNRHLSSSIPRKPATTTPTKARAATTPSLRQVSEGRSYSRQRYPVFSQKTVTPTPSIALRNQRQQKSPSAINHVQKSKQLPMQTPSARTRSSPPNQQRQFSLSSPYSYATTSGQNSQKTSQKNVIARTSSHKTEARSSNSRLPVSRQTLTSRKQQVLPDSRSMEHQDSNYHDDPYARKGQGSKSPLMVQHQQTLQLFLAQQLKNLAEQQLKIAQQMPLLSSKKKKSNFN